MSVFDASLLENLAAYFACKLLENQTFSHFEINILRSISFINSHHKPQSLYNSFHTFVGALVRILRWCFVPFLFFASFFTIFLAGRFFSFGFLSSLDLLSK
jgi:hypothetical protein